MALYGKALADQIPANTTGNQARSLFGTLTTSLHNAYVTLQGYDATGVARVTGLDAGSVNAGRTYLNNTNEMLSKYYAQMPVSDDRLTADQLNKLKVAVSTTSVAVKTIDDLFSTSWGVELFGNIAQAAKDISSAAGGSIADVAGAFLKKTWWIFLGAGLVYAGVIYVKARTVAALAPAPRSPRTDLSAARTSRARRR